MGTAFSHRGRAEQGYEVDQIANDIVLSRQNVEHYMEIPGSSEGRRRRTKRLSLVNSRPVKD
jgi:hypothetical protein